MRKKRSGLVAGVALSLVLGLVASCDDDASDQISAFVPGPVITAQPGGSISGDAVVPDPANTGQPDKGIPTPVGAPTIPPGPNPNAPPLSADDPISLPPPSPVVFPASGTLECTTVTNGAVLVLTATVPDGVASISDITIENLNRSTTSMVPVMDIPTLADQSGLVGDTTLSLGFTVPFSQAIIGNFTTDDTIVLSLRITDLQGNILILEAAPCDAIIDPTALPPPDPIKGLVIDQLSLQADQFFLAQTQETAVVGFGPVIGPRAIDDNFDGPGSGAFPDNGIREINCGPLDTFFIGGVLPVLLVDQELGFFVQVGGEGVQLAPSTTLGVTEPNSVVLAGQRLLILSDENNLLTGRFSPANFDEVIRINYSETRTIEFTTATCEQNEDGTFDLSFDTTDVNVADVLQSAVTLFTLRGSAAGQEEPNQGLLLGAEVDSDRPIEQDMLAMQDPRFSGVFNLLDVSSNQIRTDIALVVDQVSGMPTQAAIRDLPIGTGFENPVSGDVPFVTGSVQPDGQECPPDEGIVCGRFQFNQPFPFTAGLTGDSPEEEPDVLVFSGTFTGRIDASFVNPQ